MFITINLWNHSSILDFSSPTAKIIKIVTIWHVFAFELLKQNKQGVAVNREKMAQLTKMGRHCLTFSGRPRALPASENMWTRLGPSLAQTRHTSICGGGPGGVTGPANGGTDWLLSDGTPGDAAIPTLLGLTKLLQTSTYLHSYVCQHLGIHKSFI